MIRMIRKMIRFRMTQKVTRGAAKKLGFGPLAGLLGVIGGFRAARRH